MPNPMRVVNCIPMVRSGSVTVMARDMGRALRTLGMDVMDLEYLPGGRIPRTLPRFLDWLSKSTDGGLLVDINGVVVTSDLVARATRERPGTFKCFTFLTDTPLCFNDRLREWPEKAIVGLVDRSFEELVEFMRYQRPQFTFFPHGGPPVDWPSVPTSERNIDILFVGNLASVEPPTNHAEMLYGDNVELIKLFLTSLEALVPNQTPFETCRRSALAKSGVYTRNNVGLVATHLELYLSNVSRQKVLSSLEGLEVTVTGNVMEDAFDPKTGITARGFQPFEACLDLMRQAKVVLNVSPGFPNGGHERIFYALSQGAAVMTTESTFLADDRGAHGFVEFFDITARDAREKLIQLLADLDQGTLDRDAMLAHYEGQHTWRHRLEPVLVQVRR